MPDSRLVDLPAATSVTDDDLVYLVDSPSGTPSDRKATVAQLRSGLASSSDLSAHTSATTSVHGIADTSQLYRVGGTDVAVADGGTGASTAAGARANLGLGGAATLDVGTSAGTVAAGDDARITGAAQKSANLSDLANTATARSNLGLGSLATLNTVTSSEIADGTIVNADISASAAIALSKLATDPLARANHTGTQAASTITGLAAVATSGSASDLTTGTLPAARLSNALRSATATFSRSRTLAVSTGTHRFYMPHDGTIIQVRASVGTAPTGASIMVDVNRNGTTVFTTQSNRPTISAGSNTATAAAIDVASLTAGDYLTVDIDQVGSTVAGADLTVQVTYTRS